MASKILTVPVGVPQLYRPNGFPHSFFVAPGAGGTVQLDYSLDGGLSYLPHPLGAAASGYSMSTQLLNVGAGLAKIEGPTQAQIPASAIVRATATIAPGLFIASELGAPVGTLYERQTLVAAGVALASQAVATEQTVFSMRLPAGFLPLNCTLDVDTWWTFANTVNVKTVKTYFGNSLNVLNGEAATAIASDVATSMAGGRYMHGVAGRNDGATLISSNAGLAAGGGFGSSTTANVTVTAAYAGPLAVEQALTITVTKATAAEVSTLDRVMVRLQQ